jgi:hypothetical protein
VDVNPVANRIRVVTDLASDGAGPNVNNFIIDPTTGAVTVQSDLDFTGLAAGAAPEVAVAYTNSSGGATTLYGIVSGTSPDQLVINGTAGTPGNVLAPAVAGANLGVDATTAALDIGPNNTALAALTVGGTTQLYSVNLTTGVATAIGNLGAGATALTDIAVAPAVAPFVGPVAVGGSLNGQVQLVTAANGTITAGATVTAFSGLNVNVRTATADVNGDGIDDLIAVTGPGTAIQVKVISGADNTTVLVAPFSPFTGSEGFTGGGYVSAGDLDGDGKAEIVVSPDQGGGPRVTIFKPTVAGTTVTLTQVANFFGIDGDPNFRGGARTALGDINADGTLDLAVAAGFLGGPRVALFNGTTLLTTPTKLINDFYAFPGTDAVTLRNGTFVALGDLNGDGKDDLIFGGGPGGSPRVFILDAATVLGTGVVAAQASPLANFFVAGNDADRGGVRVASADLDGDLRDDLIVGSGDGAPARVRVYLAKDFTGTTEPSTVQELSVFGGGALTNGVFVG